MAEENNVTDVTATILQNIQAQLTKLDADVSMFRKEHAADNAGMRASIAKLDLDMTRGLEGIQHQLDGHRLYAVDKDRDFEARLKKLEELQHP